MSVAVSAQAFKVLPSFCIRSVRLIALHTAVTMADRFEVVTMADRFEVDGFEFVAVPCVLAETSYEFEYINHNVDYPATTLYTTEGPILFQTEKFVTEWHGSLKVYHSFMTLLFHCFGDTDRVNSVVLRKISDSRWDGVDHLERCITMTCRASIDGVTVADVGAVFEESSSSMCSFLHL